MESARARASSRLRVPRDCEDVKNSKRHISREVDIELSVKPEKRTAAEEGLKRRETRLGSCRSGLSRKEQQSDPPLR